MHFGVPRYFSLKFVSFLSFNTLFTVSYKKRTDYNSRLLTKDLSVLD